MKNIEEVFADYLEGKIPEEELTGFFMENPGAQQEFEDLKQLFMELPETDNLEVSDASDAAFYRFLNEQKPSSKPLFTISFKEIFKYAAMFLAVGGAYYFGSQKQIEKIVTIEKPVYVTQTIRDTIKVSDRLTSENQGLTSHDKSAEPKVMKELASIKKEVNQINEVQHKMILAMLRQESASSRLQAINYSHELDRVDNNLMEALFETLENDPSVNVRLAALEAVGRFELNPDMKEQLVLTLAEQRDPSLQTALITKLIELREVKALPVFASLINNPNITDRIRSQAEYGMKILNM